METLILVVMLISGDVLSRPVPAATCPAIAMRLIVMPEVTSAWCESGKTFRPVFTTVSS